MYKNAPNIFDTRARCSTSSVNNVKTEKDRQIYKLTKSSKVEEVVHLADHGRQYAIIFITYKNCKEYKMPLKTQIVMNKTNEKFRGFLLAASLVVSLTYVLS